MKHDIFFDEKEHVYIVDGAFTPSVTDILAPLHRSYKAVNPSVLEYAANRGTAVHEACEAIDLGLEPEVYPETEGYIRAYLDWRNVYRPKWEAVEKIVYNERSGYIGTVDRAGHLNDREFAIVDIKTSQPTKESLVSVCLQTYAYMSAYTEGAYECKRYGLFLKSDGSWRFQDCEEYERKYGFFAWDAWRMLVRVYKMVDDLTATRRGLYA